MSSTTKKKHVEKEMYEDYTMPSASQTIAKIVGPRGNNLHQVIDSSGEEYLASMISKFRKHVWVKRGDYVVTESVPEGNKVKAEIIRILMKDQISFLQRNESWPSGFKDDVLASSNSKSSKDDVTAVIDANDSDSETEEFIVCNPNRQNQVYESESESSSEDSDDDIDNNDNSIR